MSGVGAILLASAMFMPWYRVAANSVVYAGSTVVSSPAAAPSSSPLQASLVDGYHALPGLGLVLLGLAALALLDVLLPLLRAHGPVPGGAGGAVVLLGAIGVACAVFRMVDPPASLLVAGAVRVSLREGAWLALIGSVTVMVGGMWPRCAYAQEVSEELRSIPPGTLSWG